ncbi:hypothetical protein G6F57_018014 [Rhizopus arrhizus]|nr:hypothetical protein G6F57_018014 [Rhizopus arrhizus]
MDHATAATAPTDAATPDIPHCPDAPACTHCMPARRIGRPAKTRGRHAGQQGKAMLNFKRFAGLCAFSALCAASFAVHAQTDAKSQALTIVVPYGAGGIVDNTARAFAQKLAAELGRPVVVENRGGAGGMIGMNTVARAHDENTLGFTAVSPVTTWRRWLP